MRLNGSLILVLSAIAGFAVGYPVDSLVSLISQQAGIIAHLLIMWLVIGLASFIIGKRFNNVPDKVVVDPTTSQEVLVKPRRILLFFMPVEIAGVLIAFLGAIYTVATLGLSSN